MIWIYQKFFVFLCKINTIIIKIKMNDLKFDLDDIVIVPAEKSEINSRKECNVTTDWGFNYFMLPLMASPMDTVVSENNFQKYIDNGIIPCLPRGQHITPWTDGGFGNGNKPYFQSFGLCEVEKQLYDYGTEAPLPYKDVFYNHQHVLIDIANGHMEKLITLVEKIKRYWPKIQLMVGNVANPETFVNLGLAGADYVRCSIGTGAGCTTAANVSINYPMGSLIQECYKLKKEYKLKTKIVADGGMKNYSDIIKALALGADYVMMGSTFNKSIESAGYNYLWSIKIGFKISEFLWRYGFPIKKKYRGMSTKAVQRSWGKSKLVTAEGITKYQKVEHTLGQWTENFSDYLRSAMSYCGAKKLDDFIGITQYVFITDAARKRFDK